MGHVDSVVTECAPSLFYRNAQHCVIQGNGTGAYAEILAQDLALVSKTQITRYGIDLENPEDDSVFFYEFNSADAPSNKPMLDVEWTRYDFYSAALGSARWAGFDTLLSPDLETSASWEALSESLQVYLVWQNSGATGLHKLSTPIPINDAPWWGSSGFSAEDFSVVVYGPEIDAEYHACPSGDGPQVALHEDGTLTVKDLKFGGIGSKTRIELRAMHPDPDSALVRVVVLQWDHPGTYYDAELETEVDAAPDGSHAGIVVQEDSIYVDSGFPFPLRFPARIVEWVSADISGVEPMRVVDEADLAALSAELGHAVNWGFGEETPNYQLNVNMFGYSALYIDAMDLSLLVTDIGDSCAGVSKPGVGGATVSSARDRILAWFGIAASGQVVQTGPAGELGPGYEVVDYEQNRRAIADPYGWRHQEP